MHLCRLCYHAVNTRRPRGAEETDTRRAAQDSSSARGSEAGIRVEGWTFSVKEEKRNDSKEQTETRVAKRGEQRQNPRTATSDSLASQVVRSVNV